jgi:predicted phage terminase large subunit-like protein
MTKGSKRFVCTVCNTKKSPTAFLSRTSTVCSACEAVKQAPEPVPELPAPLPVVTETIASEAPFKHVDAEVDPSNPTVQEMAARTLARRRLLPFIKRFRPKYDAGWVHEDICRRLERFVEQVELGQSPRLLLMMPVRTGKSEIASRHFAPWVLGKHPDWEIIAASGAQSLAMSFSRYIRDLVRDPSYQAIFSGMRLDPSSQSVENWNTTSGGGYLAAGTGSMITGRGAHCVVPYCLINTSRGTIPAAKLKVGDICYGYDHEAEKIVETTIVAVSASVREKEIVRVVKGPALTRDHRIFNPETNLYQDAGVSHGMPGLWLSEGTGGHSVLGVLLEEKSTEQRQPYMRVLWGEFCSAVWRAKQAVKQGWRRRTDFLLQRVQVQVQAGQPTAVQQGERRLFAMRKAYSWAGQAEVLLSRLLRPVPRRSANLAGVQWSVFGAEDGGPCEAQRLPSVRPAQDSARSASYRSRQDEQRYEEFDRALQAVPHQISSFHGACAEDLAALLPSDDYVVDLQTGTGNFFATGLLVHNCLIIDDPVKDAEAADSQVIRDATWEWYMSTAYTRLAPGGGVLGIMTWWSEDDWAGRIQQVMATGEGDVFEIVKYAAINELGDEYILPDDSIVEIQPGAPVPVGARMTRPKNTALHPARYTLDMLLRTKRNYYALGQQRWWSALYQQNPTPAGGVFFTKDMFTEFTQAPPRQGRAIYQAWDFAITDKQKSDWTVGVTGLLDENDTLYILDVWRFKTDDGIELGTAIVQYAQAWGADGIAVEDGQIWKSIKANFDKACETRKHYPSYEVIVPLTDKRVRAQPLRGRMQQGKVQFAGRAPWYPDLKNEMLRFEAGGKHDDQVDATAHLVRLVTTQATPRLRNAEPPLKSWKDKLKTLGRSGTRSHMTA